MNLTRKSLLALLPFAALAGCQIPAEYAGVVNDGAKSHAAEHVTAGQPAEKVLCSIGGSSWLIPSSMVVRHGGCDGAWAHAAGTMCTDISCEVLGDDGIPPTVTRYVP